MNGDLATLDAAHFAELEKVIETGKTTFVSVGLALTEIREDRLYRNNYSSFEEYCQKRWGWSRQRASQLEKSAAVVQALPPKVSTKVDSPNISVPNEKVARELAKVPPEKRAEVVTKATESGQPVTAKSVKEAAVSVLPKETRKDSIGRTIPAGILDDWERAEKVAAKLRGCASEIKLTVERGLADRDIIFAEILNPTIAEASGLFYTLSQLIPYSVCTDCQGRTRQNCQLCRKRGWISKFLYNSPGVSKETKAIIEKGVRK